MRSTRGLLLGWHLLGGVAATWPAVAAAQQPGAQQDGEFSVQRFEPPPGPRNFLTTAGARTDGELAWNAALLFDYQRDPFIITSCTSAGSCSDAGATNVRETHVVGDVATWNLMGSLTPIPMVQIGLRVPILFATGDGIDLATGGPSASGLSGAGLGDMTLEGKVRIWGEPEDMFVFGAAADLAAPLGHATGEGLFIGNATPLTGGIRGIVDFELGPVTAAANLRGVFKEDATVGLTTLGPEFRWGLAVAYQPHDLVRVLVDTFGATRFTGSQGTNAWEIDGGVQVMPVDGRLWLTIAGGTGLIRGVGVPIGRAIIGLSFTYEAGFDEDGDGIDDDNDDCPTDAEDRDKLADRDGCPEDDADHDKLIDLIDKCPDEAESENGFEDADGCPDKPVDSDSDGVFDDQDKCPQAAGRMLRKDVLGCPDTDTDGVTDASDRCADTKEDTDGFDDADGCLDEDNDGDGVLDEADQCDDAPETPNGVDDDDGCPDYDPDKDNDGVADKKDRCQQTSETLNGVSDGDGCAELTATLARVNPHEIALLVPIEFDGAEVKTGKSETALTALANGLVNWSAIGLVAVTVTVAQADAAQADARANAVVQLLVDKGVAPERLQVKSAVGAEAAVTFAVVKAPPWEE
jgi:OOP family OmpA-OmpF porin